MGDRLGHAIARRPDCEGGLIMPADMPFIREETLQKVVEAVGSHSLAAPVFKGRRGHPVWFGHSYFGALSTLTGDQGGRTVVAAASEEIGIASCRERVCQ